MIEQGNRILKWYLENKRDLPWRNTQDPYKIWVSEIMLQQTRVETVIDYYRRFMESFPNINSLAAASEEAVLAMWKGLGYYSRARNLHKAAKLICDKFGGSFPSAYEEIKKLPGIGEYTAGAISCIAYNRPFPAVDGNVLRVMARLVGHEDDITLQKTKDDTSKIVGKIIPEGQARDFCQALMELGAMICIPASPKCGECPVGDSCIANQSGLTGQIPVKKKKNPPKQFQWQVAWIEKDGKILLEHRINESLLAKLWGFPMVRKMNREQEEKKMFFEKYGLKLLALEDLGSTSHVFTHQIWNMDVMHYQLEEETVLPETLIWKDIHELDTLAVPTVFQRVIKLKVR